MGFYLTQNATHLHHPLEASQQGVLGLIFTYGNFIRHNTPHILVIYIDQISRPMYVLNVKPALSAQSDFTVAIATVHRLITARFKGYFGILAALSAYGGKHLASGSIAAVSITL